jgi:hypothetical protein
MLGAQKNNTDNFYGFGFLTYVYDAYSLYAPYFECYKTFLILSKNMIIE